MDHSKLSPRTGHFLSITPRLWVLTQIFQAVFFRYLSKMRDRILPGKGMDEDF